MSRVRATEEGSRCGSQETAWESHDNGIVFLPSFVGNDTTLHMW